MEQLQKIGKRKCQNCKEVLDANSANFRRNSSMSLGISYKCRFCGKTPYDRKYREKNKEQHYEKKRVSQKERRLKLRFTVLQRDGFKCRYCGATSEQSRLQVDHIFPKSLGGKNDIENYITACVSCNIGKGDSVLSEFP